MSQINLSLRRVYCTVHGEPFRKKWPSGHAIFSIEGMTILLESESFYAGLPKDSNGKATVEGVNKAFDLKPICCSLSKDKLLYLYSKSEIGESGICQICFKYSLGTAFSTSSKLYRHVCFNCVCERIQPTGIPLKDN